MEKPNDQKTLRDEFAMAALTGMLAAAHKGEVYVNEMIENAYKIADQALLERKK